MTTRAPSVKTGIPELIVLSLLAEREMYGYDIAKSIKLATKDVLCLGDGVLYPALHVMESRGLLRSRAVAAGGRTRIYYRLTSRGKRRLAGLKGDWRRLSRGVDFLLAYSGHD